jgi:hypothetical protein
MAMTSSRSCRRLRTDWLTHYVRNGRMTANSVNPSTRQQEHDRQANAGQDRDRGGPWGQAQLQASEEVVTVVSLSADSSMASASCWSCDPSASG